MSTIARLEPALAVPAPHNASYVDRLAASPDWPLSHGTLATRVRRAASNPKLRYGLLGFAAFFIVWYVASALLTLPRFKFVPDPWFLFNEWISRDPKYGISLFTPLYYEHILVSTARVYAAFALAVIFGAPLGILLGWSRLARNMIFPLVEILRPIPPLAWVPLAVLTLYGTEMPVIFVTLLAAFFATVLNTFLGVVSIDESYLRAAACLGYGRWQTLIRVVVPGALPFIFTGLQISVGVSWFSLVAAEMVSGQYGLGYVINTSYTMVRYPTIVIGMITLGMVGYVTSAMVRVLGDHLMQWRTRELALGGQ